MTLLLNGLPVQKTQLTIERERFAKVIDARTSSRDLIGLANKLLDSDKFSPAYKPHLFADLVAAWVARVTDSTVEDSLATAKQVWVGDIIRTVYQDDTDQVVCALVRRALEFVTKDEVVDRRLHMMLFAGFVKNGMHALELALDAGLPAPAEQRIRDALARLAARPIDESCPF
jgi:hypothetical protein